MVESGRGEGPLFSTDKPASFSRSTGPAAGTQPGSLISASVLAEPGRRCSRRCPAGQWGGSAAQCILGLLVPSQPWLVFAGAPGTSSFRRPTRPSPPLSSPWERRGNTCHFPLRIERRNHAQSAGQVRPQE